MFRLKKKNFCQGTPPPPVKGKIFDTRFGLIHVQTAKKKIFVEGPPPPPVKGNIFDTRFGLIHVQTEKKNFCQGTPPPPVKGKNFDTRFGLIHVQTAKKKILSRDPPPGIARNCYGYAAGGMPLAFTQEDFLVMQFLGKFCQIIGPRSPLRGCPSPLGNPGSATV